MYGRPRDARRIAVDLDRPQPEALRERPAVQRVAHSVLSSSTRPAGPGTTRSARATSSGGASAEATATFTPTSSSSTAAKASRSVVSSPAKSARVKPARASSARTAVPLCDVERREHLEDHPPEARAQPCGSGAFCDLLELGARRFRVLVQAVVVREREPLVLDRPVDCLTECLQPPAPVVGAVGQLEAVAPGHLDALEPRRASRPSSPGLPVTAPTRP